MADEASIPAEIIGYVKAAEESVKNSRGGDWHCSNVLSHHFEADGTTLVAKLVFCSGDLCEPKNYRITKSASDQYDAQESVAAAKKNYF